MIRNFYDKVVLPNPAQFLVAIMLVIGLLGWQATKLEVDASAETLLLEDDQDLQNTREINSAIIAPIS